MFELNESDIITTDRYLEIARSNSDEVCYIKTDYLKNGNHRFDWRGSLHPSEIKRNAIVGHSDYSVETGDIENFDIVFCVNRNTDRKKVFSLPLGIANDCDDLPTLKVLGDKQMLVDVSRIGEHREILAYQNFSVDTYATERAEVCGIFGQAGWLVRSNPDYSKEGRHNYLLDLRRSKFCLCPRGNGIDTHRLWECLYLGCIPIVKYHGTHDFCHDLPVLFIDTWHEVNEAYLHQKWDEYKRREWNFDKLRISYWDAFIRNELAN